MLCNIEYLPKLNSREILFIHNTRFSCPICLTFCTVMLCAKFQNDRITDKLWANEISRELSLSKMRFGRMSHIAQGPRYPLVSLELVWNSDTRRFPIFKWVAVTCPIVSNACIYIRRNMMTSSNGNIFRATCPLWGESTGGFPSQRSVTQSFDIFFDVRLNKWLNKQPRCRWFETPPRSLCRHCNETFDPHKMMHLVCWKL